MHNPILFAVAKHTPPVVVLENEGINAMVVAIELSMLLKPSKIISTTEKSKCLRRV
jgi:hypothetical protein